MTNEITHFPINVNSVSDANVTSSYGYRTHPVTGEKSVQHHGVDFGVPKGEPIYAVAGGKVIHHGWESSNPNVGYGKRISIKFDEDSDYFDRYGHLSEFAQGIEKGSIVEAGQLIGYAGSTGSSTGNHLHYERSYKYENPDYDPNVPGSKKLITESVDVTTDLATTTTTAVELSLNETAKNFGKDFLNKFKSVTNKVAVSLNIPATYAKNLQQLEIDGIDWTDPYMAGIFSAGDLAAGFVGAEVGTLSLNQVNIKKTVTINHKMKVFFKQKNFIKKVFVRQLDNS